jgi:hypothetical protein
MALLQKHDAEKTTYLNFNFKEGTLDQSIKDPSDPSKKSKVTHPGIEGEVKSITHKEKEYEGTPYDEIRITFMDNFAASFSIGSQDKPNFGAAHFMASLRSVDFTKPFTIRIGKTLAGEKIGSGTDARTVDKDFVWTSIRQGDQKLTRNYGVDQDTGELLKGLPEVLDEKRNGQGKVVYADYSNVREWLEDTLELLVDRVSEAKQQQAPSPEDSVDLNAVNEELQAAASEINESQQGTTRPARDRQTA